MIRAERQYRELQDELTNEREFNQLHKSQVKEQKQQMDELKGKIQELSQLNKQLELFGQQRETTISEIQARCAQLVVRCSLFTVYLFQCIVCGSLVYALCFAHASLDLSDDYLVDAAWFSCISDAHAECK